MLLYLSLIILLVLLLLLLLQLSSLIKQHQPVVVDFVIFILDPFISILINIIITVIINVKCHCIIIIIMIFIIIDHYTCILLINMYVNSNQHVQQFLQVWGLLRFGSRTSTAADGHLPATTARHVKRDLLEVKETYYRGKRDLPCPSASNHRMAAVQTK